MRTAFLFGKLPAHGDFVSRGIASDERDALDLWLAASLAQARDGLGDLFDDRYEAAPPWRFAWAHPDGWTAGAMALSVDGVGRRYPILAALSGIQGEDVEGAAQAAEVLLYAALEAGWDANRLHVALASTAIEPLGSWAGGEGWWTLGSDPFIELFLPGSRPAGLMTAVLTRGGPDEPGAGGVARNDATGIKGGRQDA